MNGGRMKSAVHNKIDKKKQIKVRQAIGGISVFKELYTYHGHGLPSPLNAFFGILQAGSCSLDFFSSAAALL